MKTLKIKVRYDGSQVEVGVDGVKGSSCTDLTKSLENALMSGDPNQTLTPEYYEENPLTNSENV